MIAWLLSAKLTTVSVATHKGLFPLGLAALEGREDAVARLLSAGSNDTKHWLEKGYSPPFLAIVGENEEVSSGCFWTEEGWRRPGDWVTPFAMMDAIRRKRTKDLQILLDVKGEGKQKHWANAALNDLTAEVVAAHHHQAVTHHAHVAACPHQLTVFLHCGTAARSCS